MPRSSSRPLVVVAVVGALVAGCGTPAEPGAGAVTTPSRSTTTVTPSAPPTSAPPSTPSTPEPSVADAPAPAPPTTEPPPGEPPTTTPPAPGTALAALATLEVKGRAPKTGYDRDQFGQAWADVDRNGCDTRNDVLRRDLVDVVLDARTGGCVVLTGLLADPYTGETLEFTRGVQTSSQVQVDHVVALSDAWQKGAQQWDAATREALANDPLNLLAVDGPTNGAKGDGDAATWLPPRRSERCAYVARQVAVKADYGAWVTSAERDAVARVLGDCPDEPLPTAGTTGTPPRGAGLDIAGVAEREPSPEPDPEPDREDMPAPAAEAPADGSADGGADPRFDTCGDALDAGYGEYLAGQDPEYDWYRDGDGDGVVCEG